MSGNKTGAIKSAAKRLGLSLEEYVERVNRGEKHCRKCRKWKPLLEFHVDNSRADGRAAICKDCRASDDPYASLRGRISTFKGKKHSAETREKLSKALKGKPGPRLGIKHTEETKLKISLIARATYPRGKEHYNYKHGLAQRNSETRRSPEYGDWRKAVFERDDYTCQDCGDSRGGNLRAHHIKPFSEFPGLRLEVSNGITLCHQCHERRHFKPDSIRNQRKLKRGQRLY